MGDAVDIPVAVSEDSIAYLEVPIAITGCILYIFVGIAIHHYKETYHHMPWIHESSVVCLLGVLMGGIIKAQTGVSVQFDGNLFFYLVLPPVIFSAGYSLKRKNFFKYMDLIAFFGIFGTICNFVLITAGAYAYGRVLSWEGCYKMTWNEALVFSAVLTGSDEVSARSLVRIKDFPRMGALIFGEGVVNDALSIVLFKTFLPMYEAERSEIPLHAVLVTSAPSTMSIISSVIMQIVCSLFIGLICGLMHARLMRSIPAIKHFPIYQTALVLLFGYLSYCVAEGFGISGILTIFISAIALAHYSWYNLCSSAQIATRISFAGISEIAEGFAFSYVGLSLWVYESAQMNILFSIYMIIVVIGARLLSILVLFKVCSYCSPSFRVPLSEQLCFVLGGVVRGCLCWAQILQIHNSPILITTTLIIVMTTSLGSGVLLPMLLPMLQATPLPSATDENTVDKVKNKIPFSPNRSDLVRNPVMNSDALVTPERKSNGKSDGIAFSSGRCSNSTGNSQSDAHSGNNEQQPEYHFAYEPFSVDFPHSHAKDREVLHNPALLHPDPIVPNAPRPIDFPHDPLDDLRTNEELIELISSTQAARRPSIVSMLFWQWVRFDETFMKPLFGGSDRRYRLLRERGRQSAQDLHSLDSESWDHPAILESNSASVEMPLMHQNQQLASSSYGSISTTAGQRGSEDDLEGAGMRTHQRSSDIGRTRPLLSIHTHNRAAANGSSGGEGGTKHSNILGRDFPPLGPLTPPAGMSKGGAFPSESIKFESPGGREYVLEEDRESEMELEMMADEICRLDQSMDDREG